MADEGASTYRQEILQMMFINGETAQPDAETTWMIEHIIKEQVFEMISQALVLANRRGSKTISVMDIAFQFRHDKGRIARLKNFLYWRDIRKNAKDSDDKGAGDDVEAIGAIDTVAPQSLTATASKKPKIEFPWEDRFLYTVQPPDRNDDDRRSVEDEDEEQREILNRLAAADARTENMTREEYAYWSECRQASFTFKKSKRFRQWVAFDRFVEGGKLSDDVVDVLGFLICEIIKVLTEEALKVKVADDLAQVKAHNATPVLNQEGKGCSLFEGAEGEKAAVTTKHVREAFRRLQVCPKKYTFMRQGYTGVKTRLRLM